MKKLTLILAICTTAIIAFAQIPQSFKYQAVLRNTEGQIISNESVLIKISILSQSETGEIKYIEEHSLTTNSHGLITLNISEGEVLLGSFSEINWGASQHFLKLELDYNNTGYIEMGISPLLSVPYALHAETASNTNDADADPSNEIQTISYRNDTLFLSKGGAVKISGSVSNFSGDYNDLTNTPTPGGDISGEIDSLSVIKIRGMEISSNIPANGQVLKWNETEQKWMPDEDGLGAAGTMDGVVSSVGIEGTTTKTMTLNRSNGLSAVTAAFNDMTDDADADSTNEIQTLSYSNDTLYLSKGGFVKLTNSNFSGSYTDLTDVPTNFDTDTTNEIQQLALIGDTLALTKGGGKVPIPNKGWGGLTDEALFAVVNKVGDTVFAVYDGGVIITVEDNETKGRRSGFAIASRSAAKGATADIMTVNKESVNIIIDTTTTKGRRSGFAVASRSAAKGEVDILNVSNDSVRIYIDESTTNKGRRSGFAVASRSAAKGSSEDILTISKENVNIIIDTTTSKGRRSGFAVASRSAAKSTTEDILNVSGDSVLINLDGNGGFKVNEVSEGNNSLMSLEKENYFIGHQAGSNNNNSLYNTFLGYQSGISHKTGNNNIYIGYQSAYNDLSGQYNIFIGHKAGYSNTNGSENLFIGDSSGYNNTDGKGHVFLGHNAGISNTTGDTNTFIGYKAGQANTTGYGNAFLGTSAGYNNISGYRNVFLGPNTGRTNTTGRENVFVGFAAGYSNTEGFYNTFLGKGAGYKNTTGKQSTFVGVHAGTFNTTGYNNAFLGADAGTFNTTGSSNAFFGAASGYKNTTGINNTYIGTGSGFENTTGIGNTFVGTNSGFTTVGDSNIFIGYFAGYNATGSNQLFIDNSDTNTPLIHGNFNEGEKQVNINGNFVTKGDAGIDGNLWISNGLAITQGALGYGLYVTGSAGGTTAWNGSSDERLKKNITTIPNALNRVMQLRGVNFEWKDTTAYESGIQIGFIAQEALETIPEVVNKKSEYYSMQYAPITAILVEAIKEQQKLIESQNKLINQQAGELSNTKEDFETLKTEIEQLKLMIANLNK